MGKADQRGIIDGLISAKVIARAKAARLDAGKIPRHQLCAAVLIAMPDRHLNRGGVDLHNVVQQAVRAWEVAKSRSAARCSLVARESKIITDFAG